MGETIAQFTHIKNIKRLKVPQLAKQFYSEETYVAMVIKFGQLLIRNHEIDWFKEFFFSQNCLYMDDRIITSLLEECFNYLVPECTVPIFAFCSAHYNFIQSAESQKIVHEYFSCDSDAKVTESQIQDALILQKALTSEDNSSTTSLNLDGFLNNSSTAMADEVMKLVLEHNLFSMHLTGLREKANKFWKSDPSLSIRIKMGLMESIYNRCSIEVATDFLNA